ncbi:cysteine desulfurase [Actinomycetaceae bacterium TAE3-ERU4]|nr:cysteine desulfurase [Actinomycetaceae bacterium TAE3-ERU4]
MSVYLDYAASAPMLEEVFESYVEDLRLFQTEAANPSSLHLRGRKMRELLEDARAQVATSLECDAAEVIFTSGATESNALALSGAVEAIKRSGIYLSSKLEHPAGAKHALRASERGMEVVWAPVNSDGCVDVSSVQEIAREGKVRIASFMAVDNEIGTVQPISDLVNVLRASNPDTTIHCDAAQAVGKIPFSFKSLGLDAVSISAHKFGGPVGVGALIAKRLYPLRSDRPGGGQERDVRSGTQNVAGARALAHALRISVSRMEEESKRLFSLRNLLLAKLDNRVKPTTQAQTSPHILHLSTGKCPPEVLLMAMDQAGIAVSAGSACSAGVARPSTSLLAMGYPEELAMGSLRVSLGSGTTVEDIEAFNLALGPALDVAERFSKR